MNVVDASVVVAALVDAGPVGKAASEHLRAGASAPELIDIEVLQALRRLVRTGACDEAMAEYALATLANSPLVRVPHSPLLKRAWELRENLTAYDATYVALAEAQGRSLITCDAGIARAPGKRCTVLLIS